MGVGGAAGSVGHLLPLLPWRHQLLAKLLELPLERLQTHRTVWLGQLLDHIVKHPIAVVAEGLAEDVTDHSAAVIAAAQHLVSQLRQLPQQRRGRWKMEGMSTTLRRRDAGERLRAVTFRKGVTPWLPFRELG